MGITYCSMITCSHTDCSRHQFNAPPGKIISIANLNDGYCFGPTVTTVIEEEPQKRARLLAAVCRGTQKTNYKCDDVCKAMCGNDGTCAYCSIIADAIEEEFR